MRQHSIKYNFLMNLLLSMSQIIFPLITFPYVSRILLAEGNGKVTFATSAASYFLLIASLGIPTYGIRACAQVRNDKKKLSKTVHEIFIINAVTTCIVMIVYIVAVLTIPKFKMEKTLFLINGLNILFNMFGMNWLFQGLEQYDYITIRSIAFKFISLILMFIFVHQQDDYIIYGGILVFAAVGANFLNLYRTRQYIDFKYVGKYSFKNHLKPIFILFAQSLAVSIYTNLDTIMLGFIKTDIDVGYYNAAVKIKTVLISLVTSLGNVLLPRMSFYVKENKSKEFLGTMQAALNFTMLLSIPLAIYFSLFSKDAISFLAGNGYDGAVISMRIITISVIPIGITGILGVQVLTALEKEKYVLYSVSVGAVIDLILNSILIPYYGSAGASIATVIAEFSVLIVQIIYTKELLEKVFRNLRGHIYLVISICAGIFAYGIKFLRIESSFINLMISGIIFGTVYICGLILFREKYIIDFMKKLEIKGKLMKG